MTELKVLREKFYEQNMLKCHIDRDKIKDILKLAGFTAFNREEIPQYQMHVDAWFQAKKDEMKARIDEHEKHAGDWRKTIFPTKLSPPCPIGGCKGVKLFNQGNSTDWECSHGGLLHARAMKLAGSWKRRNKDVETTIEERATQLVNYVEGNNVEEAQEATVQGN